MAKTPKKAGLCKPPVLVYEVDASETKKEDRLLSDSDEEVLPEGNPNVMPLEATEREEEENLNQEMHEPLIVAPLSVRVPEENNEEIVDEAQLK
ncbi:hypothetical protein AMTR_s00010p00253420 [Amborella trichopoda]|uniref:Uncharacterized protein n=1 Tax=Amborella trichopoda TaxID=13333 RepID=W1NFY2_AMBTC|nr:hypothetical protein AMTR_s00010p00253420 [Amborella trichopoda]